MPGLEDVDFGADMTAQLGEIEARGDSAPPTPSLQPSSSAPPVGTPPAPAADPAAPAPPAWAAPPKSWAKEMHDHYATLQDPIKEYVHKRDKDYLDGIMQYKTPLDKWNQTLEPFKELFNEQGGMDPHHVFGSLMNAHLILKFGTPEQKAELATALDQDYGMKGLYSGQAPNAEVQNLTQRLRSIETGLEAQNQADTKKVVDSFFADSKNEFAKEVVADMHGLIKSGAAQDLPDAYQKAIWLNPTVRAKLVEREAAAMGTPKKGAPTNVRSSATPAAPTSSADESIDDTLKATMANILSRT